MDLRQLAYFVRVVELRSFSKASRELRIAQPALGAQIRKLEREFGTPLFRRHARGVDPTEAGLTLLRHAQDMLLAAERTRKAMLDLAGPPRGRVDLGLPPSHFLAIELSKRCLQELPDVSLNLVEEYMTSLIDGIADDRLDIACVFRRPQQGGLIYERLLEENLLLVGAPGVVATVDGPVAFRALAYYRLLLPRRPHRIRQRIDELCAKLGTSLRIDLEMEAEPAATQLVMQGVCCTLRPDSSVRFEIDRGWLEFREIVEPTLPLELGLIVKERRPLSKAASAVIALFRIILNEDRSSL
jgi:LysR family nitrogen assimilation transcriptional regulator